jgi:hypothetical protein
VGLIALRLLLGKLCGHFELSSVVRAELHRSFGATGAPQDDKGHALDARQDDRAYTQRLRMTELFRTNETLSTMDSGIC